MKRGSALLLVIFIFSIFLVLTALLVKIVYNNYASASAALTREQAFCLAEAGLEKGKVELAHNPNWYTDLPYYLADNTQWLINYATGQKTTLGQGSFKVVKEKGKNRLYSIGFKGKGVVVLKQALEWQEL